MEDQAPEMQASGAQEEEIQEQETSKGYADIVIFCHPRNVSNLVQSFEDEIQHAEGALPMFVLWSGVSGLLHQGVIVLEWEGAIPPEFLENLKLDYEIFDFVVYEWTAGHPENDKEQEDQASKGKGSDEIEGRQLV